MLTLEGLRYSPWTEKARWALDHHEIPYDYREHVVLMSMARLRMEMRRPWGDITVPVLLLGRGRWVMDSLNIARYADLDGKGVKLFSGPRESAILRWNELSEDATDAARGAVMHRMAKDREALAASLPRSVPPALRSSLTFLSRVGISYVTHAFNSNSRTYEQHRERIRQFCQTLRQELRGDYLLGEFSYADVAAAATLGVIQPVGERHLRVAPAIRNAWTDSELAAEMTDLLVWRDRVYERHRKKRLAPTRPHSG
jgi:glutathione S-transferase